MVVGGILKSVPIEYLGIGMLFVSSAYTKELRSEENTLHTNNINTLE
jgi:hypothetical protein